MRTLSLKNDVYGRNNSVLPPTEAQTQVFQNTAIVRRIASFLDVFGSEKMRWVHLGWKEIIATEILIESMQQESDWHAHGDYHDAKRKFFTEGNKDVVVEKGYLVNITASCDWKDQGWGNLKGQLELQLWRPGSPKNSLEPIETLCLFGIAKHHWESIRVELSPALPTCTNQRDAASFFEAVKEGDVIQLWRYVGGGGGHELFVRNLSITFCFVSHPAGKSLEQTSFACCESR